MHNIVTCKNMGQKGMDKAPVRVHQSLPSSVESVPSGRSVECRVPRVHVLLTICWAQLGVILSCSVVAPQPV